MGARMSRAGELSTDPPDFGEAGAITFTRRDWLVLPGDVVDAKNAIQIVAAAVDRDVSACSTLNDATRADWKDFFAAWRQFYCNNASGTCTEPETSWLPRANAERLDACDQWSAQVYAWQKKIAASCAMSEPLGPPLLPPGPLGPAADLAKWTAIGLLVVGGLYVASKTGLPRLFPRKGRGK
jgi:hypothetical protein